MTRRLIKALAFALTGIVVAVPILVVLPFAIPGSCETSKICLWFSLLALSAASPVLMAPALLLAAAFELRRPIIVALQWAAVGAPTVGSSVVIWHLATAPS